MTILAWPVLRRSGRDPSQTGLPGLTGSLTGLSRPRKDGAKPPLDLTAIPVCGHAVRPLDSQRARTTAVQPSRQRTQL